MRTALKKQSPSPPTSKGLKPSWRNHKFNNIVEPTDNIVWLLKFCSGSDVKSFILEAQCLLELPVDFAILRLHVFKLELVICLLFLICYVLNRVARPQPFLNKISSCLLTSWHAVFWKGRPAAETSRVRRLWCVMSLVLDIIYCVLLFLKYKWSS